MEGLGGREAEAEEAENPGGGGSDMAKEDAERAGEKLFWVDLRGGRVSARGRGEALREREGEVGRGRGRREGGRVGGGGRKEERNLAVEGEGEFPYLFIHFLSRRAAQIEKRDCIPSKLCMRAIYMGRPARPSSERIESESRDDGCRLDSYSTG